MMFGFFINISSLLSVFSAPFGAAGSAASALAYQRSARAAMEAHRMALQPVVVDGQPHIPRVKRKEAAE